MTGEGVVISPNIAGIISYTVYVLFIAHYSESEK